MLDIRLTDAEIQDLKISYFAQADEIIDDLQQQIMEVEKNPSDENWRALKRSFHTLKGDSKAMGFNALATFAHKIEDLIIDIKNKTPDRSFFDLMFECVDLFKIYVDKTADNQEIDITDIAKKIDSYRNGYVSSTTSEIPARDKQPSSDKSVKKSLPFLRIEPERVDKIMNLVGELVIGRSMLAQITHDIDDMSKNDVAAHLENLNSSFERTLSDLQRSVMKIRMLPVDQVFRRFPRLVRDLSADNGKTVRLVIQGEKTELDKSILDVIGEPLLHIVRNAVDHGIEDSEERKAMGKPAEGVIYLRAFHQGNQIIIEVLDDGKGIDIDKLKEKAVQKGLITSEQESKMSDREALNLIFLPGFSTAKAVTEVSGRGVGMDIVKTVVESLRGIIDIASEKNKGTKITLRLPLTLAIIKSILFNHKEGIFGIPLTSVTEILRVNKKEIDTIAGKPVLRHRDGIIPLISISKTEVTEAKNFVILIGVAQMKVGLLVKKIIGEEELVIKSLDDEVTTGLVTGASILGNGKVVLVLDPLFLIKKASSHHNATG